MQRETNCVEGTMQVGAEIAQRLRPGDVVALYGELGAGKTALVAGIVEALGFDDSIASPTFTIVNQYQTKRFPVYHMDAYRLADAQELMDIGFYDLLDGGGVVLIEWAERAEALLPAETIRIRMDRQEEKGFEARRITVDWGDGRDENFSD